MTNLGHMQILEHVLQVLTEKIGKYTSIGYAATLIGKAVMSLRKENECLNYVLINETRYSEGINAFSVSREIVSMNQYQVYSGINALINKTTEGFADGAYTYFLDELRKELPEIFFSLDNLDTLKKESNTHDILIVDESVEFFHYLKGSFQKITQDYSFHGSFFYQIQWIRSL